MKIAILKERRPNEKRVAASPETVKKFVQMGAEVAVEAGAGDGVSIADDVFAGAGAKIVSGAAATVKGADVVLKVQRPMTAAEGLDEVGYLAKGQKLVCVLNALTEPALVKQLADRGVTAFAMELLPRISRAQSMDVLSSQANIAGYKAVLDALEYYGRAIPMMMTAAGTVPPAKVFVMGVGVAGLQAIATAKRLGGVVSATDVRPATEEQVQSLGADFVAVKDDEFLQAQTDGGYAKEMSAEYQKKQADLIKETIAKQDIVITTAQIPGRPAPILVTADMVKSMKPGAVLVDLAVETGGNCPLSELGKVVKRNGVTIVGHDNWPSRVPETTSMLFAKNLLNFLTPMVDKDKKEVVIDPEDQVVVGALVTDGGKIVNDRVAEVAGKAPAAQASAQPKKAAAKKTAAKKATAKKTAAKKAGAKKTAKKKTAAKKGAAKKAAASKPADMPGRSSGEE